MAFCAKCGAEIPEGADFCPKCGNQVSVSVAAAARPRREEKREKGEKEEKREKEEKSGDKTGALTAGLILVWLGISLYLTQTRYTDWTTWWPYFIIGIGVILIAQAVIRYASSQYKAPAMGFLIGGAVLLVVGFAGVVGMENWWPFILIAIGVVVIFGGMTARARTPRPRS
jgi:ribosomal protein L40E